MVNILTKQALHWSGKGGDAYVGRNPRSGAEMDVLYVSDYGIKRSVMNERFLGAFSKNTTFLEVGANIGSQMDLLFRSGFKQLLGVDINRRAITEARALRPHLDIIEASSFDLPFRDRYFDIAYTSGVLIHIAPRDIRRAMKEIHRVSKRYIWGFEYYAPKYTEIPYRGRSGLLWKTDFAKLYLQSFPDLKLVKEERFTMTDGVNISHMYLLKKKS